MCVLPKPALLLQWPTQRSSDPPTTLTNPGDIASVRGRLQCRPEPQLDGPDGASRWFWVVTLRIVQPCNCMPCMQFAACRHACARLSTRAWMRGDDPRHPPVRAATGTGSSGGHAASGSMCKASGCSFSTAQLRICAAPPWHPLAGFAQAVLANRPPARPTEIPLEPNADMVRGRECMAPALLHACLLAPCSAG